MNLPVVNRSCGECTACCTTGGIPELNKPINVKCQHVSNGCSIYSTRPKACRDFQCLWLRGYLPEKYRPDKCGIVFDYDEPPDPWMLWAYLLTPDAMDRVEYLQQRMKEPVPRFPVIIVKAGLVCPMGSHFQVRGLTDRMAVAEDVF